MTTTREAFTLPAVFLSVVLGGAIDLGPPLRFVPPPLFALVLGVMLMGALVQCGALRPELLVSSSRSTLANLNGGIVLVALLAASAQAIAVVLPASGIPAVLMGILLFALLAQALAIGADRRRTLRGLLVALTVAFVLKFIVLASLSAPATGVVGRVVKAIFEGVTLGAVTQTAISPANGYVAFAALLLYLFGLILLPARAASAAHSRTGFPHEVRSQDSRGSLTEFSHEVHGVHGVHGVQNHVEPREPRE